MLFDLYASNALQGLSGEAADLPLAAALKFAEEGVGHLIEPPQSTKHVIVRFETYSPVQLASSFVAICSHCETAGRHAPEH
eukprot:COSAG02_NODE_30561_length_548_cov_387.461024_1_plen_81_part_00